VAQPSGRSGAGAVRETEAESVAWPQRLFPLVRQLSRRVTPVLLRFPITPNQITFAAMVAGLSASWCLYVGRPAVALVGCVLFIVCQVLDNCDGEVARLKNMRSRLGGIFDDTSDWLVHSSLFIALGAHAWAVDGRTLWLWLGIITALGVCCEYVLTLARTWSEPTVGPDLVPGDPTAAVSPFDLAGEVRWMDKAVYVLRVLVDADFCFMLPAFVLSGTVWILLAAAAIGNHVYWMASFYEGARRFRA
jgi:phosphatidylglycerophosphate synthase